VVQLTLILAPDVPQLSKREVVFGDLSFFLGLPESHGEGHWKVKRLDKNPNKMFGKDFVLMGKVG